MKKFKSLFLLLALFLPSCSDYGDLPDRPILIEEVPAPQTGEDGAVATLGDFMDVLFADTHSWNGRPTISGVHTTSIVAYREAAISSSENRGITRSEEQPEDDMPAYEVTLQNADGTEGFALVVEPEKYIQEVIAFVPVGSIADTTYNKALGRWFSNAHTLRSQGGMVQERWKGLGTNIPGTEEYVRPMTREEIDTYGFRYSYSGPVDGGTAYGPLLKTEWDQIPPYNNRVPVLVPGTTDRCRVGCANVAVGQVLAYHQYPADAYNWDLITATSKISVSDTVAASEVSRLLSNLAELMQTWYHTDGSGYTYTDRFVVPALEYFGYGVQYTKFRNDITNPTIYNEILEARPVLITGDAWRPWEDDGSRSTVGHIWVADGAFDFQRWYYYGVQISEGSNRRYELWRVRVQGDPLIHLNWGWGGLSNGWYRTYNPVFIDGETYDFNRSKALWTEIEPNN